MLLFLLFVGAYYCWSPDRINKKKEKLRNLLNNEIKILPYFLLLASNVLKATAKEAKSYFFFQQSISSF